MTKDSHPFFERGHGAWVGQHHFDAFVVCKYLLFVRMNRVVRVNMAQEINATKVMIQISTEDAKPDFSTITTIKFPAMLFKLKMVNIVPVKAPIAASPVGPPDSANLISHTPYSAC